MKIALWNDNNPRKRQNIWSFKFKKPCELPFVQAALTDVFHTRSCTLKKVGLSDSGGSICNLSVSATYKDVNSKENDKGCS